MVADLHLHTTASDGTLDPEELVVRAVALGLTTIAITDHDTAKGISRALRAGRRFGLHVIPGVEMSTVLEDEEELHILGLFIDYQDPTLKRVLSALRQARWRRMQEMTRRVMKLGLQVSWSRVRELAGRGAVGRPHLARALLEKGYVSSVGEAFSRYIGKGCPAYVPRPRLRPEEAIKLIRQVQGIPILAHPGWIARERLRKLVAEGLMGLEVFHPRHNLPTTRRLYRLARGWSLLLTGGSDFHGLPGEGWEPGAFTIPEEYVSALLEARLSLMNRETDRADRKKWR
ncbi:MAG: PHP domain-containing protein [bacterium]|jgi:predicted metal-dependent phosphoesterase TrpH|nr:PHP domain-containing protein [Bacillota bacterium]HHW55352.1 PHP domain-containing protein [Bacillota bacterium]